MKTNNFISPAKGRLTNNSPAKLEPQNPHQDPQRKKKRGKKEADKEEGKRKKRSVNGGSTCKAWTGEKLKIQVAMVLTLDGNSLSSALRRSYANSSTIVRKEFVLLNPFLIN